ncbi:MAG: beta-lactamase family protein [Spirochaetales bacterium]|nr:beta-lactamase family protein [Spirochaetales bacterium]
MKTKRCFRRSAALFSVLFILCAGVLFAEAGKGVSPSSGMYEEIEDYLFRRLGELRVPGAALVVVEGDEIAHFAGFGKVGRGGEAPGLATPFVIESLTKSFTALAVMQLVDVGKVELDAPVQRYLPWFDLADPAAAAKITVRMLVNQTSGFNQILGMIGLADLETSWADAREVHEQALAGFMPSRQPGEAYEYSNINFNLLGLIIEAVTGESYGAYIENNVFTPLGMNHSYTDQAEARQNGLAEGHTFLFGLPKALPDLPLPEASLASGQLISCPGDMARYMMAHVNGGEYAGGRILSPAGMEELFHPAVKAGAMGVDMGQYAMGWFVEESQGSLRIWHDGFGPDFFSYMVLFPEEKRGMLLLVNANHMFVNFPLLEVCEAATDMLAGQRVEEASPGGLAKVTPVFLLIPLAQILGILYFARRYRKRPVPYSKRALGILLAGLPHILLILAAAGLLISGMTAFSLLFLPDITLVLLVCGGVSVVWFILRTWLIFRASGRAS